MTTEELIARFEDCTLPAAQFTHAAHVQVAWGYLQRHPLPDALQSFTSSLRRFAESLGASGKYHATITGAYMFLINERLDGDARGLGWGVRRAASRAAHVEALDPRSLLSSGNAELRSREAHLRDARSDQRR